MGANSPILDAARTHLAQGRLDQAEAVLRLHLKRHADDPDVCNALAVVLFKAGRADQALYFVKRAVSARPTAGEFRQTLAHVVLALGDPAQAQREFRSALLLSPKDPMLHVGLASAQWAALEPDAAVASCERAVELAPGDPGVHDVLASMLLNAGRGEDAARIAQEAVRRFPGHAELLRTLVLVLNYVPGTPPGESRALHERLGRLMEAGVAPPKPHANSREPERVLRVGYLSPDFRDHAVARFIEPVLANHSAAVEAWCYHAAGIADATTARLKSLAKGWRDVAGVGNDMVAQQIRSDRIDILIDLAGHTERSRLAVLARRPAPVQMTWIGYPNTTGMSSVGWRIVDDVTDPVPIDGAQEAITERALRLPRCFLCYARGEAPEVGPLPALKNGFITFGSFNNMRKVSGPTIALWARVVAGVPGARLLLKGREFGAPAIQERFRQRFADAGLEGGRIAFAGFAATAAAHLVEYARVDIALDPFPYNGTTTTCEALWMGVPVVILAGDRHAGRVGASLLTAAGRAQWIAGTADEYARIATDLARDPAGLAALRAGLRTQVGASPLCDGAGFTHRLEGALGQAWRQWCGA